MNFVEACRHLISLDSTPAHGNLEAAKWLESFAKSKGLTVELQEEVVGDLLQANVIIRPEETRPDFEFLLQTHLDTVDPGPFSLWTENDSNPFDAHIIENKIYGLGAADVKLDFLCKLEALASFDRNRNWKLPPVLVGTFGEETGMVGALKLIRKNKISAKMAVIGETSDLQIISAGKGFASVEIDIPFTPEEKAYREEHNLRESTATQSKIFRGKTVHSSTPHLGESAILKLLDHLLKLPENVNVMEVDGGNNSNSVAAHAFLEIDMMTQLHDSLLKKISNIYRSIQALENDFKKYIDNAFTPNISTLNIGMIRTTENGVQLFGTCRILPSVDQEVYEGWMKTLGDVCAENHVHFKVTDYKKPFRTDEDSMLVRGCLQELSDMGLSDQVITQSSTNEASIFSRIGIECVCFGAGKREGNMHTPHENVAIEDLHKATEFYKRIIERFCL